MSLLAITVAAPPGWAADNSAVTLPSEVKAVWDTTAAFHETTTTRERICLNGLWQWQPTEPQATNPPAGNWGYFKVPGPWPGITDYMQKDCQTVLAHPDWAGQRLGGITASWYRRQFTVPKDWAGRRIALRADYLNSFALIYLDDRPVGEIHFPGGELEITTLCRPGATHRLSLLVVAMPLKGVMLSYSDSASAREVKGSVARRGLCGDVFLVSTPPGPRVRDVQTHPSVRRREITFEAGFEGMVAEATYTVRARVIREGATVKEFVSKPFQTGALNHGRFAFTSPWLPDHLWDIHTPQNTFGLELSLLDTSGQVLDTAWTERFGFREFWTEGRDFILNGTRISLSAVPFDNAQISAGMATYAAARESLERLQSFGINYVYTHNYGCEPGSHLSFAEILRAADDVGMLVGFSQPHFSHYDWQAPGADATNGYARHAEFYVRAAQNHPAVVMYSMSHNATGYNQDMNPDLIDGIQAVRDTWALRNVERANRAEAIVKRLDPGRIIYHHASGNLGSMHVINFYPNFVPVQELSDWFGHWATAGVKPVFTCEYGAPFSWDWTMYRGWFDGKREFGSAAVPWEFCVAEWNSQFLGDRAFQISEPEKTNLRWEAKQFRAGRLWHRWDYPHQVGSTDFDERYPVFEKYLTANWRAFRTWGVSAVSPWEHGHFWKLRPGVDRRRQGLAVDWAQLQRPGFSPDYVDQRYERMDLAFERSDWIPTAAAESLLRNNRPLLAYIAGKPAAFTSQDHNFLPGQTVEKQLVIINNAREPVDCHWEWTLGIDPVQKSGRKVTVAAGQQERVALRFELPSDLAPGSYDLKAIFKFSTGETQTDQFTLHTLLRPQPARLTRDLKIALFDPRGETTELLRRLDVPAQPVDAGADLAQFDLFIVGKAALTANGPAPDIRRVREGLKVILFEQSSAVLEQRFGFRVQEYGLREIFARVPDHPLLAGLAPAHLRDWQGEATLLSPQSKLEPNPKFNGAACTTWCGISVPRLWRCGNRGNVASVLIEKPVRGDFLPIVDGGYSLQYSPLLEYHEGRGLVLFCQLDVTGRTEADPAADTLVRNLLRHVAAWRAGAQRSLVYAGEPEGKAHLEAAGFPVTALAAASLSPAQVLVVGPGGASALAGRTAEIADWAGTGGKLLALGLNQEAVSAVVPGTVTLRKTEHIAAWFDPPHLASPLAGVGPADVHNRDPRELPLVTGGAQVTGNGVLAVAGNMNVVLCQLVPWQFAPGDQLHLRRTHRRVSFLVSRLVANLGVSGATPLLERFRQPVDAAANEKRWLDGFYLDQPQEWDDPYRFFRW